MKMCFPEVWVYLGTALLSCTILCSSARAAQGSGKIVGTVVAQNGVPLADAKVNALRQDTRPEGSGVRYVTTNSEGQFIIDRLAWGTYSVFAMKEEAGYPDLEPSFYSDRVKIPVVQITPTNPVGSVSIHLGPKAAVLLGSVSDASTGAPLNASFIFVRTHNKKDFLSTSLPATYRVLVPASTAVSLSVTSPGYKSWILQNPLDVSSGDEMHLDVQLVPAYNPNLQSSNFLVPEGYVGWLVLVYNQKKAPPVTTKDGAAVFKFPSNGILQTSSPGPEAAARRTFFYYSPDGSEHRVPMNYSKGGGAIWGQHDGFVHGVKNQFGFFVGPKQEYLKAENRPRTLN